MLRIHAVHSSGNRWHDIDGNELSHAIKGCSIEAISLNDDSITLALAEGFEVQIGISKIDMYINVLSSVQNKYMQPFQVEIVSSDEEPTAELVEMRIRLLRRLYTIAYMVEDNRIDELRSILLRHSRADLEDFFMNPSERLLIKAAGPGSLWVTILTKSRKSFDVAARLFSLVYEDGRTNFLRRIKAETRLKELAVERMEDENSLNRMSGVIDLYRKIVSVKDEDGRRLLLDALEREVRPLSPDIRAQISSNTNNAGDL